MGAPGIEEVKWLAPVRPGERLTVRATVLETRPSRSRADMGFVKFHYELFGAAERRLMTLTVIPMFGRRDAAGAATTRRASVMKFFEDIEVGETSGVGQHTFTAEDIKSFAARFDPQPFHLDEDAAARSHFKGLCASGWHTVCVRMRLLDREPAARGRRSARVRGEPVAHARTVAWVPRPQVAQAGLCGRHHLLPDRGDREAAVARAGRNGGW